MHRLLKFSLPVSVFLTPALVLAQSGRGDGIPALLQQAMSIITSLIPIVIGIAVLIFLWGVLKYVVAKGEDEQKEARGVMLYGIIALFVMVSVWGLVNILGDTLNLNRAVPPPPGIPGVGNR
jgi:peptidoglycan biosynthesis protein MviN/MurJ (putative lipid II flippase)